MDNDLGVLSTPMYDEDLALITNGDNQMILYSIDTTDYTGHAYGFEADEPLYIMAVEKVDA